MRLPAALLLALSVLAGCAREPSTEAQVAASPAPRPSPDHSAFIAAVDALAAEALARGRSPASPSPCSVAARACSPRATGMPTARPPRPPARDSYPIASVSKMFTAAAILRLADQGKLAWTSRWAT